MKNIATDISKDRQGITRALSVLPLGFDRRELRIETRKHSFRGGVYCSATVVQVSEDGRSYTHAMSYGAAGDFSKTLAHEKAARATEKAIGTMHERCLTAGVYALLDEAKRHYGHHAAIAA